MNGLSTYALALAICAGTAAAALATRNVARQDGSSQSDHALDGAYRDGLYLGRLTAESGLPLRPTVGRWSSERDRASFEAGYRRAYSEVLAGAATRRNPND